MSEFFDRRPETLPFVPSRVFTRNQTRASGCFSVSSPQHRPTASGGSDESDSKAEGKVCPQGNFSRAILLVSSDDTFRSMLRAYLESPRYLVFSCTDASRASQVFHNSKGIDLLLIDLHQMGSPGLALAFELAAESADLPAVFITGPNTDSTVLSAIEQRGWNFLNKPVLLPRLFSLIQEALKPRAKRPAPQRNSNAPHPPRVVSFPASAGRAGGGRAAKIARSAARPWESSAERMKGGRR